MKKSGNGQTFLISSVSKVETDATEYCQILPITTKSYDTKNRNESKERLVAETMKKKHLKTLTFLLERELGFSCPSSPELHQRRGLRRRR